MPMLTLWNEHFEHLVDGFSSAISRCGNQTCSGLFYRIERIVKATSRTCNLIHNIHNSSFWNNGETNIPDRDYFRVISLKPILNFETKKKCCESCSRAEISTGNDVYRYYCWALAARRLGTWLSLSQPPISSKVVLILVENASKIHGLRTRMDAREGFSASRATGIELASHCTQNNILGCSEQRFGQIWNFFFPVISMGFDQIGWGDVLARWEISARLMSWTWHAS